MTEIADHNPRPPTIAVLGLGRMGAPIARAMIAGNFEPGFALRLAFKDVGLALEAAHHHGLELPMTDAIARRWQMAMPDHADDDVDSVIAVATGASPALAT